MNKQPPFVLCVAALLALNVRLAFADIIILNSGEQLQGKVLSETATALVVDVQITAGITDQRTIAKKDVKSVSKVTEDEIAYDSIKSYKLGPNSYTPADYEALVRSLSHFLTKFPGSPHVKDVKPVLDAVSQEKARVDGGQLKWNNRWFTAEEAVQEKYQIEAEKVYASMNDVAARRDTVGALNTFDFLEKNYPGARIFPTAVETAISLIKRLEPELERAVLVGKQQELQFNNGIQLVSEPQKSQMIAARKAQIAAAEDAVDMAQHTLVKWPPLLPITDKSPQALKNSINTEEPRLTLMAVAKMRKSIETTEAALRAFKAGDLSSAENIGRDAQVLWPHNEEARRLQDNIAAFRRRPAPTPPPAQTPKASPAKAAK